MPQTGNIFTDTLSVASIVLPLLPACIIFIKKNYRNETLNFLMILCLLNFFREFLLYVPQLSGSSQNIIKIIFPFFEFIILIQLSKQALPGKIINLTNIILIAFLSAATTFFLLVGADQNMYAFEITESISIIFVSILCLARLNLMNDLSILYKPLFWISIGNLFYFSIAILTHALSWYYTGKTKENQWGNEMILSIGSLAKYFFYMLAALLNHKQSDEKENTSSF